MLDYRLDSSYSGTSTEWVEYGDHAPIFDIGVMPGERATPDALANYRQRELLASVVQKFEKHAVVSSVSHEAAITFFDALPRSAPLPKVAPDGDGGLLLAWTLKSGARTLVTIDGWTLHCVSRTGTEMAEYSDDLAFDGTIPAVIQEAIAE